MKKTLLIAVVITSILSGCASSPRNNQQVIRATATPQMVFHDGGYINTNLPIHQDDLATQRQAENATGGRNLVGAILGTAVGGFIGSRIGKGDGNVAATAIGASIGSVLGSGCRSLNGGQIVGTVAGGLAGSQIGKGNGQLVATAIASSIGAQAGGCE